MELLRDLRLGRFNVLVGVNLLREGLDLPEVSLVGILDADKQGFLRSETALVQTIGRAARNENAKVILYGDKVTEAMKNAIQETARRRTLQEAYNREHGIEPKTIYKAISEGIGADLKSRQEATDAATSSDTTVYITKEYIAELEKEMLAAAEELEFERAGNLRDRITQLQDSIGKPLSSVETERSGSKKGRKTKRRRRGGKVTKVPRPRKQS